MSVQTLDFSYTQDRELSWLRFNERVMEEARDESVPLFERLKFAAIFTSNLDEFFMIRVGSIYDLTLIKQAHVDTKSGLTPAQQLAAIFQAVGPLYKQRDKLMAQLETRLRTCNICNLTVQELDVKERKQCERYFRDYVLPILSPQVVDGPPPRPPPPPPPPLPPPAQQDPEHRRVPEAGRRELFRHRAHSQERPRLPQAQ